MGLCVRSIRSLTSRRRENERMSKKATEKGEGSKKKKKSRGECVVSKEGGREGGVGTDLDLAHTLYTMPVLLLIF